MLLQTLWDTIRGHREEAAHFRRRGYDPAATHIESLMDEFDQVLATLFSARLPREQAAELSGYTVRGLDKLIGKGAIRTATDETGETLVYLAELPVKPRRLILLLGGGSAGPLPNHAGTLP